MSTLNPLLAAARTYPPPATVRKQAQRGLDLRTEFHRGGTSVGIARARDLAGGKNISEETLRRMSSFFARHAVDKRPDWSNPSKPSNGYIAWLLWGGDAGKAWAAKMTRKFDADEHKARTAAACPDGACEDTGWYGLEDPELPDLLVGLVRLNDHEAGYEHLTASGWQSFTADADLVLLTEPVAQDLALALEEGCVGLLRRPTRPLAWIEGVVAAMEVSATPVGLGAQQALAVTTDGGGDGGGDEGGVDLGGSSTSASTSGSDNEDRDWHYYAIVDDLDTGAVLDLIRIAPGPALEKYDNGGWITDNQLLARLRGVDPPTLAELDAAQLVDVITQMEPSGSPAKDEKAVTVSPAGMPAVSTTTAAGPVALVADRPATQSPNPNAARLRRYWSSGKGAAKIRWNTPGDFTRCVRQLRKYLGVRAKGYCANLHKNNTGVWPGDRRNVGRRGAITVASGALSAPEFDLDTAYAAGAWTYDATKEAVDMLRDGIYTETTGDAVIAALVAGAFPLQPPTKWFENPVLPGPTPIRVDDDGRVSGHIATFDVAHIGLPGKVHAPKSRSDYAYFKTGVIRTAEDSDVAVGQITLSGGHAPLNADAGAAVQHYDNTASAIADVTVGEDRFGVWVSGAVRSEATPEQLRALRASAPSGDWRPINGSLELVAICQVNVPGFPVARARVASGAITALVAAGATPLAKIRLSMLADAAVGDRLALLEQTVFAGYADEDDDVLMVEGDPAVVTEDQPQSSDEQQPVDVEKIEATRAYIKERRKQRLRDRVRRPEVAVPVEPVPV